MKKCVCIEAPMGSNGLEGFELNESYEYDWDYTAEDSKKKLYCVHLRHGGKGVMKKAVFKRYFKPIRQKKNNEISKPIPNKAQPKMPKSCDACSMSDYKCDTRKIERNSDTCHAYLWRHFGLA